MANEFILVDRTEDPLDYVVADGTGIEKGALLKLTDSGTAIISTATGDPIAGVAAREKIASDGRTQLAVFKKGRFRCYFSGAVTIGAPLISLANTGSGNENVVGAQTDHVGQSGCQIIGYAEAAETNAYGTMRLDL